MRWVKLHTTLHRHFAFRRLSAGAKLVFYVALEIAGDLEQEGALAVRGAGPLTVAEIAEEVGIKEQLAKKALDDLIGIGFMALRDGAYVIEKWAEKTGPDDPTAAERKRRSRDKSRVTVTGESRVHTRSREEEREGEVYPVPTGTDTGARKECGCGALASATFDAEATPEHLADPFLEVFLACKTATAKARHRATVVGWLREMHDGHAWEAIFEASARAHADGEHAPIWTSAPIWTALKSPRRHLAAVAGGPPTSRYTSLDGR